MYGKRLGLVEISLSQSGYRVRDRSYDHAWFQIFNGATSVMLFRGTICSPSINFTTSDVNFTWGPWPVRSTFTMKNLTACANNSQSSMSIIQKGFVTHLGMRWATHNLFHSMTEAEAVYHQVCRQGLVPNLGTIDLILLQYHPSFETSLFGDVLREFIGFNKVRWWNSGANQTWLIEETHLPSKTSAYDGNCNFKAHVNTIFAPSKTKNDSALIINRKSSRNLANANEVIRLLNSLQYKTKEVYFEDLAFQVQVDYIQNHSIIISPHGAAWTIISLFSQRQHLLIEIMHVTYPCEYANGHHVHPWRKWISGQYFPLFSLRDSIYGHCKGMNGDGDMVANISELRTILID